MGKRILVVDDDPGIRKILRLYLEHCHCVVETAEDGSEALGKLEQQTAFDGVLLDYAMPGGIDGLAVLHYIRRNRPSLPVIMMTGGPPNDVVPQALAGGARSCLLKPFGISELDHVVESWSRTAA